MWLAYRRCSEDPRGTLFRRPAGIFQQANTFKKEKRDIVRGEEKEESGDKGRRGGKEKRKKRGKKERREGEGRREGGRQGDGLQGPSCDTE